jgi:hypothetical protein
MEQELIQKAKPDLIDMAEKEIGRGLIMLKFYEKKIKDTKDKKDKAQIEMKTMPIKGSLGFNKELLDFIKNL